MRFFRNPRTGLPHIFDRVGAHGWIFSVCGGGWEQVETFEADIEKVSPLCQNCLSKLNHKEYLEQRKAKELQQGICDRTHIRPPRSLNDRQKAVFCEVMGNDSRYEICPFCLGFKLRKQP
jgi:hypothetical protein